MDITENMETQTIKHIDESSVRQIVAGQAIFDLSSVIKELIENSLDANAKNIIIRLHQNGIDKIQVEDDGEGVPKPSRAFLATKHATSKISKFEDLQGMNNNHTPQLGFRGEALFCLANLSEKLEITTKTSDDRVGQKLNFLKDGSLDTETVSNIPRKIGTTVTVHKLFDALPVRRTDFIKRIRAQRAKMLKTMQGYAIMCLGVKFTLMDIKGKAGTSSFKTDIKLATSIKSHKLEDTIASVMGSKFLDGLCRFSLDLTNIITSDDHEEETEPKFIDNNATGDINNQTDQDTKTIDSQNEDNSNKKEKLLTSTLSHSWKIEGMISKSPFNTEININSNNGKKRLQGVARELQFFSLNKRLVDLPNIGRVLSDAWREFETTQSKRPACILALHLPNSMIDVNLSPDKREVLLQQESAICEVLREALVDFWKDQSKGTFVVNEVETKSNNLPPEKIQPSINQFTSPIESKKNKFSSRLVSPADKDDYSVCDETKEKAPLTSDECNDRVHEDKSKRKNEVSELRRPYSQSKTLVSDKDMQKWTKIRSHFNSPRSFSSPQEEDINQLSPAAIFKNDELKNRRPRIGELANSRSGTKRLISQLQSTSSVTHPKKTKLSFAHQIQMLQKLKSKSKKRRDISEGENNFGKLDETENLLENDSDENNQIASETQSNIKDKESSVIWDSFKGTDHVIKHARIARIKAREYRKHLQQLRLERQYPADKDELLLIKKHEGDTEYVTTSVHSENKFSDAKHVRLKKEDFLSMEIIGQFNLGFIIARCRNNHLWMLDQHACDEKYNFERLCETTVIHEQKLIAPLPLELSPSEENCVMDNMDIFEINGFRFSYDESKPIRHRLSLTGLPHSGSGGDGKKAVQFGKEDVAALCAMLGADGGSSSSNIGSTSGTGADGSGMQSNHAVKRYAGASSVSSKNKNMKSKENNKISLVRLPKAIAMFASRSCRSSVMIGTALSRNEMESITRKLYHVEQPWDCPHGRPTMRHAKDILECLLKSEDSAARHAANPSLVILSQLEESNNVVIV